MSDYLGMRTQIRQLNVKCSKKIRDFPPNNIEENKIEYIIIRNSVQKTAYKIDELVQITGKSRKEVNDILKTYGFIKSSGKKWYIQMKKLNWVRKFIKNLIIFLNYPATKDLNDSLKYVNNFFTKKKNKKSVDYRSTIICAFESESIISFTKVEINQVKEILMEASLGLTCYYFENLYNIFTSHFPEIKSVQLREKQEEEKEKEIETEKDFGEQEEFNVKELIEENERLKDELNESRAASDILAMQYDDLRDEMEELKDIAYEQNLIKVFKKFNSLESNNALDAFFIAKTTLTDLKKSGWKPDPPELKSILFIFDLFTEFFKRQHITTKYELNEEIEITDDNILEFNYKGTDIKEGTKVLAKVRSHALYFKKKVISKASVIEIKK